MLGILWYACTLIGAFMWLMGSPAIASRLSVGEILAASVCVGTLLGAWVTYLVSSCLSMLEAQSLLLSMIVIIALVVSRYETFAQNWRKVVRSGLGADAGDAKWAAALVGVLAVPFARLYSSHMIPEEDGKIYSGGSCWADFPIHMHIAESFLSGRNADVAWGDMHSPVFAGEKMVYPFLPDWHAAVMVKIGTNLRWGFMMPGYLLALAFIALLFYFALRVTRSRIGAVVAVALTLGAGGMGGIDIWLNQGMSQALSTDTAQNDSKGNNRVFWFAFLPHVFLPQRGANFAYPTALLVLLLVWKAIDATVKIPSAERRSLLMHAAGLAAALPLVQAHSFIALGIIIGVMFVLDSHKWLADLSLLKGWIAAGAIAILGGGPQLLLFRRQVTQGHSGQFMKFGWIYKSHDYSTSEGFPWGLMPIVGGFFRFWWMSLGPAFPLFLAALLGIGYEVLRAGWEAARLRKTMGPGALQAFLRGEPAVNGGEDAEDKHAKARRTAAELSLGDDASLVEHLVRMMVHQLPQQLQDVLTGKTPVSVSLPDSILAPLNALSVTGRALDSLKLGIAGLAVFLVGNYINFQPWDRDNCKLFYLWVFIASALSGGILAAPLEFFLGLFPGYPRLYQWTGVSHRDVMDLGRNMLQGKSVAPPTAAMSAGVSPGVPAAPRRGAADEHIGAARRWIARGGALGGLVAAPVLLFLACFTGSAMIYREFYQYHVMLDQDQIEVGRFIRETISPKAVMVHSDVHIQPSGCLAGRPSLVGYTGWMWSHGYNYGERHADRNFILENMMKDSDKDAYNRMRRWGIRYVIGENARVHPRPSEQAYQEALKRKEANPDDPSIVVPPFDPDMFLDGNFKRVKKQGRFGVFEVLGYGFPPS